MNSDNQFQNKLFSSKSDPVGELDENMKDIRLDLGAQKLPQDEPLHSNGFFIENGPAIIHLNETIPYNSN